MTELNWAMVGSGFMSTLILKDFALAENTKLYALVSRNPESAVARLKEYEIKAKALTFEQALEDAAIDVIYVATPHSEHYSMAKRALDAGKHVLVEKAFTMDAAEARELAALAKSKNLFLMEAMWTKFLPLYKSLKQMITSGELGDLVSLEANFGMSATFDNDHRLFNNELGGGTTLDQGVYTTTFCRWLADSPIKKQVTFGQRYELGADSHADTTFEFENGVLGHGVSSLVSVYGFDARVIGSTESVFIPGSFWNARELVVITPQGQQPPLRERRSYETKGAGYAHMLEAVSASVIAGEIENAQHPLAFTIEIMESLDETRKQIH